jgi:hypothetical protein
LKELIEVSGIFLLLEVFPLKFGSIEELLFRRKKLP